MGKKLRWELGGVDGKRWGRNGDREWEDAGIGGGGEGGEEMRIGRVRMWE
jgi:hypothetical protein